jgi:hypothetical protein
MVKVRQRAVRQFIYPSKESSIKRQKVNDGTLSK